MTGSLLLAAAVLHGLRLARWRGLATWREPLLFVLHVGYGWLVVAFALLGLETLDLAGVSALSPVHALTAGAFGTMTLAVMSRAILGHGGHALSADAGTVTVFLLVTVAALLRVALPGDLTAMTLAGGFWTAAFDLFLVCYLPRCWRRRGDRMAG